MGKQTRDQLVDWIGKTVRGHYTGKVALVCLYGSHINGTADERSDVDCYFLPKTEEGVALARTFLLEGVGYDIYPAPWERLERIAALKDSHQPLVGDVQVLYADSPADLEKLEAVRTSFSAETMAAYDAATTYNDGKWVMFEPDDGFVKDLTGLLAVKRRPNRK